MRIILILGSFLAVVCIPILSIAKTLQPGIVKEYKGKSEKTCLGGVSLEFNGASSTFSDSNGLFKLNFPKSQPGDHIMKFKIEKPGFEVFNTNELAVWNLNPKMPLEIVMCKSEEFQKLKNRLKQNSADSYKRKYDNAIKEMAKLREEKKIMENEYIQRVTDLSLNYSKQLENLDNYIDQFTRIDLSKLSEEEQRNVELVDEGYLDEAISNYDKIDYVQKYKDNAANLVELAKAKNIWDDKIKTNDSIIRGIENNIKALMLVGGKDNVLKARSIYETVANTDTPDIDIEWLLKTGNFIFDYFADLKGAEEYYLRVLHFEETHSRPNSYEAARAYINLGNIKNAQGNYVAALNTYSKAHWIMWELFGEDHINMVGLYNNIGFAYYNEGNYKDSFSFYNKILEILGKSFLQDINMMIKVKINLANTYAAVNENNKCMKLCKEVLTLIKNKQDANILDVARCYNNLGNAYFNGKDYNTALTYLLLSLENFESVCGEYHPDIAEVANNLGNVYYAMGNYMEAITYYQKALEIEENLIDERTNNYIAQHYNRIGLIFSEVGDVENAVLYVSKGTQCAEQQQTNFNSTFADSYKFLADYYNNQSNWHSSLEMLLKEVNVRERLLFMPSSETPDSDSSNNKNIGVHVLASFSKIDYTIELPVADVYKKIAEIYYFHIESNDNISKALNYYKRAYNIYSKVYDESHESLIDVKSMIDKLEKKN